VRESIITSRESGDPESGASIGRQIFEWLTQGETAHGWLGWFAVVGFMVSDSLVDGLLWLAAALFLVHEFAALRRRNRLLSAQISSARWLRRLDDAYFDAVQRALDSLSPEERARFDRAVGQTRPSSVSASEGEEGDSTTPAEGPSEHAG
jgi:hypothetical protein